MSTGASERLRFTVPRTDERTLAWVEEQENLSLSLRILIHQAVRRDGFVDTFNHVLNDGAVITPHGRPGQPTASAPAAVEAVSAVPAAEPVPTQAQPVATQAQPVATQAQPEPAVEPEPAGPKPSDFIQQAPPRSASAETDGLDFDPSKGLEGFLRH